jgi:toxin-antitoxin system PIN domain toxin
LALLDVNALVALAWDSHVHHAAIRAWFAANGPSGWATCAVTESGFVRVSSNPRILPYAISPDDARGVLSALRGVDGHRFLANDVSLCDQDVPRIAGHRQVADAQIVTLARRNDTHLLTFDAGIVALASGRDVELLRL